MPHATMVLFAVSNHGSYTLVGVRTDDEVNLPPGLFSNMLTFFFFLGCIRKLVRFLLLPYVASTVPDQTRKAFHPHTPPFLVRSCRLEELPPILEKYN